jgi:hypothetical protein
MKPISRKSAAICLAVVLAGVGGGIAAAATGSSTGSPPAGQAASPLTSLPAQLPDSAGMASIPNMTLIIDGSSPLWPRPGVGQTSPTDIGLGSSDVPTGGLSQGWVLTAAVDRFGGLSNNADTGLQLPLPLDFANQNPGPSEVFVTVLAMPTPRQAQDLLDNATITGVQDQGYTALTSSAIHGGLAGSIDSAANGGMTEDRFQWVSGSNWIQVNVLGASMTIQQAQSIASRAGAG